jgi:hypothetical protein
VNGLDAGVGGSNTTACTGALASTTFTWGLCSQQVVGTTQPVYVDAYNSTQAAYIPGQLGGGIGLNGAWSATQSGTITGTLWAGAGITRNNQLSNVLQDLHSGTAATGTIAVAGDGYINGNVSGMTFGGTLYQPTGATNGGPTSYGTLVNQPVSVPDPCLIGANVPVGNICTYASTNNDDSTVGILPTMLDKGVSSGIPSRVDLPCGNFYFTNINPGVDLAVYVHGNAAIYVGTPALAASGSGSISSNKQLEFTLDPGVSLDVFVAGTISSTAPFIAGNPNYPAAMRLYVGAGGNGKVVAVDAGLPVGVSLTQKSDFACDLWLGTSSMNITQATLVYGAIYAGLFGSTQSVNIHYDLGSLVQGQSCTPADAGSDAGSVSTGCQSCADCNNQACINGACGSCTASSQCCPPLVCVGGTCTIPGTP